MKNLDELIQKKTEELNNLVREINQLKQKLDKLGVQSIKLDGAISQLKELKESEEKKPGT